MAKRKNHERYHIEIRYGNLSQAQSEYARETMQRILKDLDPTLWFGREDNDDEQKVHYVFRTRSIGELVKDALDQECSKFLDARSVWRYRGWLQKPARNQLALFKDAGLHVCVAPGDDLVCYGRSDYPSLVRHTLTHLGYINQVIFHGRSVDVWKSRRRFRHEMHDITSAHYGDIEYALSKARETLSDVSAIHVVNTNNDVYTIGRLGVKASEFCDLYDRGAQWVFEFDTIPLDIPFEEVAAPIHFDTAFKSELAYAAAIQRSKRIGQGSKFQ